MLDILSNLHDLLVNMINDAKKKEHQEVPRTKLAVSSMKVKDMDSLHLSLSP